MGLRHQKQLHDVMVGDESNALRRSMLGLMYTYNCLPLDGVELACISTFQRILQKAIKAAAGHGVRRWASLLMEGCRSMPVASFQGLFVQ